MYAEYSQDWEVDPNVEDPWAHLEPPQEEDGGWSNWAEGMTEGAPPGPSNIHWNYTFEEEVEEAEDAYPEHYPAMFPYEQAQQDEDEQLDFTDV